MPTHRDRIKFALSTLSQAKGWHEKKLTFFDLAERYCAYQTRKGNYQPRLDSDGDIIPNTRVLGDAIRRADEISFVNQYRLNAVIETSAVPYINLIIPRIDISVIFGGYISLFQFARMLQRLGFKLRFIVVEKMSGNIVNVINQSKKLSTEISDVLISSTILDYTERRYDPVTVSPYDLFIAYSAVTAHFAHNTVEHLKSGPFIFYIQEEEGHFHSNNSYRAFKTSSYNLPHIAIYNSELLMKYFQQFNLGPFHPQAKYKEAHYFRHALATNRVPSIEELGSRTRRKILFFARPELHAERNLFELALLALRHATAANMFPPEIWDIHGIGTGAYPDLPLFGGQKIHFLRKLPILEYGRILADYDIGISLMYAPHPSVPNFEMAAAGLPTVTTVYTNRSKTDMEKICPNFIASEPSISGIYTGILQARDRSYRFHERLENAKFNWPRDWADSFNEQFQSSLQESLRKIYGDERIKRLVTASQDLPHH